MVKFLWMSTLMHIIIHKEPLSLHFMSPVLAILKRLMAQNWLLSASRVKGQTHRWWSFSPLFIYAEILFFLLRIKYLCPCCYTLSSYKLIFGEKKKNFIELNCTLTLIFRMVLVLMLRSPCYWSYSQWCNVCVRDTSDSDVSDLK